MSIKVSIKNKNSTLRHLNLTQIYNEIEVQCGDSIYIDEEKKNLQFECINDDLKLFFNHGKSVLLKNFVKLLCENPNKDIPAQFNDMSILNSTTTLLEFVKSDLFDEEYCIKDFNTLQNILKPQKNEEKVPNLLHKSVKFQYEKATTVLIGNETFEQYRENDLTIYICT